MATFITHTDIQAVRRVYESGQVANTTPALTEIIHIACYPDASSGKNIILWDDVIAVFSTAIYIRSGTFAIPFLKGPNFKKYSLC
jgi:hypothetical protein